MPDWEAIERDYAVLGSRGCAKKFGVPKSVVHRHMQELRAKSDQGSSDGSDNVLQRMLDAAMQALRVAQRRGDHKHILEALDTLRTLRKAKALEAVVTTTPTAPMQGVVRYEQETRQEYFVKFLKALLSERNEEDMIAVLSCRLLAALLKKPLSDDLEATLKQIEAKEENNDESPADSQGIS